MSNFYRAQSHSKGIALALFALAATVGGCLKDEPSSPQGESDLATVRLALQGGPADLACITVKVATNVVDERKFDPRTIQGADLVLRRLPVGSVVFTVDAFNSGCDTVAEAAPTWTGGPLAVVLVAGANQPIPIAMKQTGQATVTVSFPTTDAGDACAALGSACLTDGNCCSSLCDLSGADERRIGACAQPPQEEPQGKTVQVTLTGGSHYLFYPDAGGPGCSRDSGTAPPYIATVTRSSGDRCLRSPDLDRAGSIVVVQMQVCRPGGTCEPCPNCLASECFADAALEPIGTPCGSRALPFLAGGPVSNEVHYFVLPSDRPRTDAVVLPRLFKSETTQTIRVASPDGQSFVVAKLGQDPTTGDMCGGDGLCGLVDYTGARSLRGWSFTSAVPLRMAPLY